MINEVNPDLFGIQEGLLGQVNYMGNICRNMVSTEWLAMMVQTRASPMPSFIKESFRTFEKHYFLVE